MSTQEKADNELDNWFKKSLEEPDISFDPQAWQAMQAKLEKDRSNWIAYWTFFGLLALLMVSVGIGIWYWQSHERQEPGAPTAQMGKISAKISPGEQRKNAVQSTLAQKPINRENAVDSGKESRQARTTGQDDTTAAVGNAVDPASNPDTHHPEFQPDTRPISARKAKESGIMLGTTNSDKSTDPSKGTRNEKVNLPNSGAPTDAHRRPDKTSPGFSTAGPGLTALAPLKTADNKGKGKRPVAHATPQRNSIDARERILEQGQGTNGRKSTDGGGERESEAALFSSKSAELNALAIRPFQRIPINQRAGENAFQQLLDQHPGIVIPPLKGENPPIAKKRAFLWLNKMSLSVMMAPDLSTVRFSDFTTPGTTQGLAFAYQLNEQLSVSIGALYSIKRYYAEAKDYTPPKPWPPPAPYRINGNCNVIDLPINIRYNVLMEENFNVYLSGGLSSYLMQKEHYNYEYTTWSKSWDAPKGNRHWLSVLNLSAGYERKLSNRLSLQIEPYLKLPLAGVGAGKVKLSSTGAFLSLKYRLHR